MLILASFFFKKDKKSIFPLHGWCPGGWTTGIIVKLLPVSLCERKGQYFPFLERKPLPLSSLGGQEECSSGKLRDFVPRWDCWENSTPWMKIPSSYALSSLFFTLLTPESSSFSAQVTCLSLQNFSVRTSPAPQPNPVGGQFQRLSLKSLELKCHYDQSG